MSECVFLNQNSSSVVAYGLIEQETSDKSVIELQQYAKKNKPNLHILNKLQEEMKKLAQERVSICSCFGSVLVLMYKQKCHRPGLLIVTFVLVSCSISHNELFITFFKFK